VPAAEPETTPTAGTDSAPSSGGGDVAEIFARARGIDGLHFEIVMTAGPEKEEFKTWVKGNRVKNETSVDGQILISIMDFDKAEVYTYMPDQNMAMKTAIDMQMVQGFQKPTEYTDNIDPKKVRIVETATHDGLICKVMVLINDDGHEEMKMWVSEEYGIPLRVETDDGGFKTVIEYKNLEVGSIPDDVFTIPQGVQILETDMGGSDA
jgi:outer membrane lipoprotein-sorting protein